MELDLLVIGSGPSGQKAAIQASKLGKRVAVAERKERLGGVSIHTGTIPSKTLREAVLDVLAQRPLDVLDPTRIEETEQVTLHQLMDRASRVIAAETAVVREQFRRNRVGLLPGQATFVDDHTLSISGSDEPIHAERIIIAVGTRPARPGTVDFDDRTIIDSDGVLKLEHRVPRTMTVVGAGVIGVEYASMFTALGVRVTLIEQRPTILDFVDHEIVESLTYCMRQRGTVFRLGEKVVSVRIAENGRVIAELESGKQVSGDTLLYAVGRQTNADLLDLGTVNLAADPRGRIPVDQNFRTSVDHIYAAGDVIGFPALASTSMEQGRLAVSHMFGHMHQYRPELLPYGIYTVPEISMVGRTEQELTARKIPYEFGIARYSELAKSQMLGADVGLLKVLFDPRSLRVLGVHAIGDHATEVIHIGQAVLSFEGTMEYFRDTVFNYPTLAEAYKVAGLDGLNKVGAV